MKLGSGDVRWCEFAKRRAGMSHALSGGLWLHRHTLWGEPMAHLVSSDRALLLEAGKRLGLRERWLQYKPLKDPQTGKRVEAWHWDLRGRYLDVALHLAGPRVDGGGR
jgi:hypothetical protein